MGRSDRDFRGVVAVAIVSCVALGGIATTASAAPQGSPARNNKFSSVVTDYVPAQIDGTKVVIDPRSPSGSSEPSCQIPPGGAVFVGGVAADTDVTDDTYGGLWECTAPIPTGFVAGLAASKSLPNTPKLSKKVLYTPPDPADTGSVKVLDNVKIDGRRVRVFTWRTTIAEETPAGPAGTVFEVATAEPRRHLLVNVTTPAGVKPLRYLRVMLEAGSSK